MALQTDLLLEWVAVVAEPVVLLLMPLNQQQLLEV
jgi:hypothetical protein